MVNKQIDDLFFTWSVMGKQNNTVKFGVPGFSTVPVFRGVPMFQCSGVLVFRCSGVPVFLVLVLAILLIIFDNARQNMVVHLFQYSLNSLSLN